MNTLVLQTTAACSSLAVVLRLAYGPIGFATLPCWPAIGSQWDHMQALARQPASFTQWLLQHKGVYRSRALYAVLTRKRIDVHHCCVNTLQLLLASMHTLYTAVSVLHVSRDIAAHAGACKMSLCVKSIPLYNRTDFGHIRQVFHMYRSTQPSCKLT